MRVADQADTASVREEGLYHLEDGLKSRFLTCDQDQAVAEDVAQLIAGTFAAIAIAVDILHQGVAEGASAPERGQEARGLCGFDDDLNALDGYHTGVLHSD